MTLKVGDQAPEFSLKTITAEGPKDVTMSSMKGSPVVLLFFPLVNTPVCHQELCSVRDDLKAYETVGAKVCAISVDSPFAQKLWADANGYTFTLLSDFNKEASKAYGALFEDLIGLRGVSKRSAFVVDKEGIVRFAAVSDDPKQMPDFDAIKACVQSLS
ncbi:MAG: redoxin domain-containing protein [Planctomycetes bacterium]|nr:redoxin domain-containing protein [Planctomycetota bacterium]